MSKFSRMGLAKLIRSQRVDAGTASRLTSRRSLARRAAKQYVVDLSEPRFGERVLTGVGQEPYVAARWSGRDFIVTRAVYVQPWRDWPPGGPPLDKHVAWMRQGTRHCATVALRAMAAQAGVDLGFRESRPWLPHLAPFLESVGVVRLTRSNRFFENDSMIQWSHYMRDGIYDVWAGFSIDKNGKIVWLGQYADDDRRPGFIPIQYGQRNARGHGVELVFRFKQPLRALPAA